ncbi:MAG TPA: hypothetical protein VEA99_08255 [Gemmatimonadaceae bacterium]|nr:hypothetical protein [Gemmatimonadaceae bacterium]
MTQQSTRQSKRPARGADTRQQGGASVPSGTLAVAHLRLKPCADGEDVTHFNALDALVAEVAATGYSRRRDPETRIVTVRLHLASGDTIVGQGATNDAAIVEAGRKARLFVAAAPSTPTPEA